MAKLAYTLGDDRSKSQIYIETQCKQWLPKSV